MITEIILTLMVSAVGAFIFYRMKLPAGALIGAVIFCTCFSIFTGKAYLPAYVGTGVQIVAGGFIGQRVFKEDLDDLKIMLKPALQLLFGIIFLSFLCGILIHVISDVDLLTALFSSVPGGMSDITMICMELGGNVAQTTLLQIVRLCYSTVFLPYLCIRICKKVRNNTHTAENDVTRRAVTKKRNPGSIALTIIIALVCGSAGKLLGIPAGAIVFSMIGVSLYNIKTRKANFPKPIKLFAQTCAGAVIGSRVTVEDIKLLPGLIGPVLVVIINCLLINFLLGFWIHKTNKIDLVTSLFSSVPAGLSDMALISLDIGGNAPQVALLQLIRYIGVISLTPALINLFVQLVYP